jgi:hypothetical protein
VLAERRGLSSAASADKGFYYLGGLAEASETLLCFALMCLWPEHFGWWAYGFASLCALTIVRAYRRRRPHTLALSTARGDRWQTK